MAELVSGRIRATKLKEQAEIKMKDLEQQVEDQEMAVAENATVGMIL